MSDTTARTETTLPPRPEGTWDPVARSPLHRHHVELGAVFVRDGAWEVPATYGDADVEDRTLSAGVGICDITARGKIDLRGDIGPLLTLVARTSEGWRPGTTLPMEPAPSEARPGVCAPISEEWALLFCPPGALPAWLEGLEAGSPPATTVMITDVSSHYAGIALAGPRAPDLLARLTGSDLRNLPPGTCASTRAIEIGAILVHRSLAAGASVVELWVGSDHGRFAWETVVAAGRHLGGAPVGRDALGRIGWW